MRRRHIESTSRLHGPRTAIAASALLATLALAGCGDDDDAAPAGAPTTTGTSAADPASTATASEATNAATTSPGAATAAFDASTYCAAAEQVEASVNSAGDPDEDPAGVAASVLEPLTAAAALAPTELTADYDAAIAGLQTAIDTADPTPIFETDRAGIHAYDLATCDWTALDVDADDYHFTGLPETLPAGTYSFELTNTGAEAHVLVLAARLPGVTETWEDILEDPEAESKATDLLGVFAAPGETGFAVVTLEPGEYLALCPIPQGTTGGPPGDGPPHFVLGMQHAVTVTA
jgi:hypothetical protein